MEQEIKLTDDEIVALKFLNGTPHIDQTPAKILNDAKRLAQFEFFTNDSKGNLVTTAKGKQWLLKYGLNKAQDN
ncbi:MAG: hypothetical protein WAO98_08935 [Alphaproteobacteria bacterium]